MKTTRFVSVFFLLVCSMLFPRSAIARCVKDTDCKGDRICTDGVCQAPPQRRPRAAPPVRSAGCTKDTDCKGDRVCQFGVCTVLRETPAPKSKPPARRTQAVKPWRCPGSFALSVAFGVSGCTNDCNDYFDALVGLRFNAMARVHKYVSLGLHLSNSFLDLDGADVTMAFMAAGEARFILPVLGKAELWAGLAVGYIHLHTAADDETFNLLGVGLGWGFGAHYFVTRWLALGASFWLNAPFFFQSCHEYHGNSECEDLDVGNPVKDFGLFWSVSTHVTFYFGR